MNKYDPATLASKPTTPIDQISETLRVAREVADRARYLVGRLCGHLPESAQAANPEQPSNGVLNDLAEDAVATRQRLLATLDELVRLENSIG